MIFIISIDMQTFAFVQWSKIKFGIFPSFNQNLEVEAYRQGTFSTIDAFGEL
jgi:hypothetical protein